MINLRYFNCRALPYLIPLLYLLEEKEAHVISPWISNVTLLPPPNPFTKFEQQISLLNFAKKMRTATGVDTVFYVRDKKEFCDDEKFRNELEQNFDVKENRALHAKAIVTKRLMYVGSANITHLGLYVNIERCQLQRTPKTPRVVVEEILEGKSGFI
jgi:hypothetical protein